MVAVRMEGHMAEVRKEGLGATLKRSHPNRKSERWACSLWGCVSYGKEAERRGRERPLEKKACTGSSDLCRFFSFTHGVPLLSVHRRRRPECHLKGKAW